MRLKVLKDDFSVCKVEDYSLMNLEEEYCFIGKTDEENSLVCITDKVPQNVKEQEDGWKAFRIEGVLDFSLIGILSKISGILADNQIGIFAISTYHTDYIFTKKGHFEKALSLLSENGYEII